ncbi:MAG: helix-turn-helix transcriptional regulator [Actinobacteria bacterium]|nr:helix-turn-helix transcriptional regulator [Actinomycetota bacterium]
MDGMGSRSSGTALTAALRVARIATGGLPVAPHVAGRLAAFADGDGDGDGGDKLIIRDLARTLSPAQLRGSAILPDPLPLVPSARTAVLDDLGTAARRLLLFAAIDPDLPLPGLLDAAGVEIDLLLFGDPRPFLTIESGRVRFTSQRMRAQVLCEAQGPERRAVHAALARAAQRRGRTHSAARHLVASDPRRAAELAAPLLAHAEARLAAGDPVDAHRLALLAAPVSGGSAHQAWKIAALGALWAGAFDDAGDGLRRAIELEPDDTLLHDLMRTRELMLAGPAGALYTPEETEFIFRSLAASAPGAAERTLLTQLGDVYTTAYRDPLTSDDMLARTLLSSPAIEDSCWSPHAAAHRAVSELTALVVAGELDAAARLIERTAPVLPLILPGAGIVAGHVRACLGRAPGVDPELARAYERIGPPTLSRFEETSVAEMFPQSLAERAGVAAVMAAPATQPSMPRSAPLPGEPLSARQQEVLTGVLRGLSNREIGDELGVSHRTVEVHATQVLRKYGVPSRSALIALHTTGRR